MNLFYIPISLLFPLQNFIAQCEMRDSHHGKGVLFLTFKQKAEIPSIDPTKFGSKLVVQRIAYFVGNNFQCLMTWLV